MPRPIPWSVPLQATHLSSILLVWLGLLLGLLRWLLLLLRLLWLLWLLWLLRLRLANLLLLSLLRLRRLPLPLRHWGLLLWLRKRARRLLCGLLRSL